MGEKTSAVLIGIQPPRPVMTRPGRLAWTKQVDNQLRLGTSSSQYWMGFMTNRPPTMTAPRQSRSELSTTRLINAAAELIVENGYERTTLAAIPHLKERMVELHRYSRESVIELIQLGVADGTVDPSVDSERVARLFLGALRGAAYQAMLDPQAVDILDLLVDRLVPASGTSTAPYRFPHKRAVHP